MALEPKYHVRCRRPRRVPQLFVRTLLAVIHGGPWRPDNKHHVWAGAGARPRQCLQGDGRRSVPKSRLSVVSTILSQVVISPPKRAPARAPCTACGRRGNDGAWAHRLNGRAPERCPRRTAFEVRAGTRARRALALRNRARCPGQKDARANANARFLITFRAVAEPARCAPATDAVFATHRLDPTPAQLPRDGCVVARGRGREPRRGRRIAGAAGALASAQPSSPLKSRPSLRELQHKAAHQRGA